ncbi:MAG: thioredoxin family protein [Planctomycetales bacterium]|nr:thioredoxin family protein [Planctomycetales bacterium]
MYRQFVRSLATLVFVSIGGIIYGQELDWTADLIGAQAQAKSSGKDLFILVTGDEYCFHCVVLRQEILRHQEFQEPITQQFVVAMPDKTDKKLLSPTIPTVILQDSSGTPYGYLTGFASGTTIEQYLEKIESLVQVRHRRDDRLAKASTLSGVARAEMLDQALEVVGPALGPFDHRREDALLVFYEPTVDEIIRLAGPGHALTTKYEARRKARLAKLHGKDSLNGLDELFQNRDFVGIKDFVETHLPNTVDSENRLRLELARQSAIEALGDHEAALENARRLLHETSLPEAMQSAALDREAYNLFRLDRIDEMLAQMNRRITAAKDSPAIRRRILMIRSSQMMNVDPPTHSIAIHREFRADAEPGTEYWFVASLMLATTLQTDTQYEAAMKVLDEVMQHRADLPTLIEAANCQLHLGNRDETNIYLAKARVKLAEFQKNPSPQAERQSSYFANRIAEIEKNAETEKGVEQ